MKSLIILRHAKTLPGAVGQQDHSRILSERGHSDSDLMGNWLLKAPVAIDTIISSTAHRARQTTEHINQHLQLQCTTIWEDCVYDASPDDLLSIVQSAPQTSSQLLVIGHNPGLARLISGLCSRDPVGMNISLPTCGMALLSLEIPHWPQARWGCGELQWLTRPKLIR